MIWVINGYRQCTIILPTVINPSCECSIGELGFRSGLDNQFLKNVLSGLWLLSQTPKGRVCVTAYLDHMFKWKCQNFPKGHPTCTCGGWSSGEASLLTWLDLMLGCFGRQDMADDQVKHGSSTGCRQQGHHTEHMGWRCSLAPSPAATHWPHMVWEHGRIRVMSLSCLQAGQWGNCCKQSVSLSSSSPLLHLPTVNSLFAISEEQCFIAI